MVLIMIRMEVLLLLTVILCLSSAVSVEDYLTLSQNEKVQLDKFKDLVSDRLPHDYMKTDIFLIPFLREADYNIEKAERLVTSMVAWREENKMDGILQEDFTDLDEEYISYIEGCDKQGRPIISVAVGDWDVRRLALVGRVERIKRYVNRIFEEIAVRIRDMQAAGANVTQGWVILDLDNVNIIQHACPSCISLYIHIVVVLQTKFPGFIHRAIAVNTPEFAIPLYDNHKNLASPKLVSLLTIYGTNKKQWRKDLLQEIDVSQLTKRYGGSRKSALDRQQLRRLNKTFRCTTTWEELIEQ